MKRNIVFLTAITFPGQEQRSEPYKYGIKSWQHWCDKNDCDLFVLDEPIFEPEYCKPNLTLVGIVIKPSSAVNLSLFHSECNSSCKTSLVNSSIADKGSSSNIYSGFKTKDLANDNLIFIPPDN